MSKSPVTVQQWVDTLPPSPKTPKSPNSERDMYSPPGKPNLRLLGRDVSVISDDCSHCSSVESVLEFRRADPEAVLLGLGFGPANSNNFMPRIPQRFLQPSKLLTQIDINKFLEDQGEVEPLEQQFVSNPPSPARVKPKTY